MKNFQNDLKEMKNDYCFPKYTNEEIKEAFDIFDINKNEYIGVEELKEIFSILNENVSDEELDEMISLADKEGDGQVNWFNFYEFITGNFAVDNEIKYMKRIEQEKNEEKNNIKNYGKNYKFLGEGEVDNITDINFSKNINSKLGTTNLIKINKDDVKNKEFNKKINKNDEDDEDFFSSEDDDEKKYGLNYDNFIKNMLEKKNKNNKIVIEDFEDDERNKPKKIVLENVQKKYSMHTNSKGSDSLIMINDEEEEKKEKKIKKKMKNKKNNKIPINNNEFSRRESNFIQNKNNQLINLNNINIKNKDSKNFEEKNKLKNLNDSSNLNLILDSEKNNNDIFKTFNEKNSENNLIINSKNSSLNKKNSKSNSLNNSNDSNSKEKKNSSNEKSTPKLISYESTLNNQLNTEDNLILNDNKINNKMNLIENEKNEQNFFNEENNNKNINPILINVSKNENKNDLIEKSSNETNKIINKNENEKKINENNSKEIEKYFENESLISEKKSILKNDNFNSNKFEKKNKSIIHNKKNLSSIKVEKKEIKTELHKKINLNLFSNDINNNIKNKFMSKELEKINSLKENSNEENEEDEIIHKKSGIIKHSKAMKPTKNFLQKITKLESEDLTNLDYKKIEEENDIKQQQYKNKIQPFEKMDVKNEFMKVDLFNNNVSKKQSIKNLIKSENIKIKDILNFNKKFENDLNEELTFNKFIEKFRFQDNNESNNFFENFKKISKKNDDEIIIIKNILILLNNHVDNNLLNKDKFNYEFKILDKNKSNYITKLDLINLIELNFLTSNSKEINKKFNLILNDLKNMGYVDEEVFDYDILFELFNKKPNLFFPSK